MNDYVDLPYFKDVRPEDIEDVSEEFVPLFSNEREADRIKEIKIRGENNITSFFLISLIEHKSNFTYPPIIPIVYYEGKGRWTAPMEFKDKIMFGETFKEYFPNFSYYIVPIHDYSNEMLIDHGDEISLVMLINKLQTIDDVEQFRSLPAGKVKENKMGELFANMDKMDIQAERRKTAEALKIADEERQKGIKGIISSCKKLNASKKFAVTQILEMYAYNQKEAEKLVDCYWND